MKTIVLKNQTEDGIPLEATFAPERGMNLVSYKRGDCEVSWEVLQTGPVNRSYKPVL